MNDELLRFSDVRKILRDALATLNDLERKERERIKKANRRIDARFKKERASMKKRHKTLFGPLLGGKFK